NARSAAFAALYLDPTERTGHTFDLFEDGSDSATIEKIEWGGLELIHSKAWMADQQACLIGFAGRLFNDRVVLELSKGSGPLHLCGDARIRGDISIPGPDIRRGYI